MPLGNGGWLERRQTVITAVAQGPPQVRDLRLDHQQHRIVTKAGIGAQQHEQVGKPGDAHPQVRLGTALPAVGQQLSLTAAHPVAERHVGDMEAGAEDDRVDLVPLPVGIDDGVRGHLGDPGRDHIDVVLTEGRIPGAGPQDSLAPEPVVRDQLGPQLRIGDLLRDGRAGPPLDQFHHPRMAEAIVKRLVHGEDRPANP